MGGGRVKILEVNRRWLFFKLKDRDTGNRKSMLRFVPFYSSNFFVKGWW